MIVGKPCDIVWLLGCVDRERSGVVERICCETAYAVLGWKGGVLFAVENGVVLQ